MNHQRLVTSINKYLFNFVGKNCRETDDRSLVTPNRLYIFFILYIIIFSETDAGIVELDVLCEGDSGNQGEYADGYSIHYLKGQEW